MKEVKVDAKQLHQISSCDVQTLAHITNISGVEILFDHINNTYVFRGDDENSVNRVSELFMKYTNQEIDKRLSPPPEKFPGMLAVDVAVEPWSYVYNPIPLITCRPVDDTE